MVRCGDICPHAKGRETKSLIYCLTQLPSSDYHRYVQSSEASLLVEIWKGFYQSFHDGSKLFTPMHCFVSSWLPFCFLYSFKMSIALRMQHFALLKKLPSLKNRTPISQKAVRLTHASLLFYRTSFAAADSAVVAVLGRSLFKQ